MSETWECDAQRSHGVCNTPNGAEDESCGACGADRPAPREPAAGATPARELFNEDTLRAEIVGVWGEYGAHVEVFDMLLAALRERDAAREDAAGDVLALIECHRLSVVCSEDGWYALAPAAIQHGTLRGTAYPTITLVAPEFAYPEAADTLRNAVLRTAAAAEGRTPETLP